MPQSELLLYQTYSREEIHDLFDPETSFTPQTGSWGLHGIIRIPGRPEDFGLIVTFGRSQSEYTFDEGISSEGVLRWQSQPQQRLADRVIRDLIAHNEDNNSVYLFLRTEARVRGALRGYTYLGPLKYIGHDNERERPVHFAWQLLQWPIPNTVLIEMGLKLEQEESGGGTPITDVGSDIEREAVVAGHLVEESPPKQEAVLGESTRSFRASKQGRRPEHETRALGLAGKLLVLAHEQRKLTAADRPDLAKRVVHTAVIEGTEPVLILPLFP